MQTRLQNRTITCVGSKSLSQPYVALCRRSIRHFKCSPKAFCLQPEGLSELAVVTASLLPSFHSGSATALRSMSQGDILVNTHLFLFCYSKHNATGATLLPLFP